MKKVLFIGIGFYDYDIIIKQGIEKLGYKVDYFCETPMGFDYTVANKFNLSRILQKYRQKHSLDIAQKCGNDYDFILVIKGDILTKEALDIIKLKNKKARTILYLWDSIERVSNFRNIKDSFDKIFSFDRVDTQIDTTIIFKPLFYRSEYNVKNNNVVPIYDLFFVGWSHSDRAILLKNIVSKLENQKLKVKFLILVGKMSYYISPAIRVIKNMTIKKPIQTTKVVEYCLKSKAVLDLAHPNQTGLTMRTIEVLFGVERKLITTNKDIVNYDFYNENNIFIIDRNNLEIPRSFFEREFKPYSKEMREKLFVENWIKDFFE